MMGHEILSVLVSAWANFLELLARFLPRLLAMFAIVVTGWLVAWAARAIVRRALRIGRVSSLIEKSGAAEMLRRASAPPLDRLVGAVVFWIMWLGALLSGIQAVGLGGTESLVADVVRFVPRLVVATLILVVGVAVANFLWRATLLAAVNARIPSARLLGGLVRLLALGATVAMALAQIGVADQVVQTAFTLVMGGVMLAAGIAFGLGGRGIARRFLEEALVRREEPPREEPPHV